MKSTDITLIGSGTAATVTLIQLFQKLKNDPEKQPKPRILVIEKSEELWTGVPYGYRSSINSLIITSVHDFINEEEKPEFYSWFQGDLADWVPFYKKNGGEVAERWLQANLNWIETSQWEKIYIPRSIYGRYLKHKVNKLLEEGKKLNLADFSTIKAEVTDIKPLEDGNYEITVESQEGILSKLVTKKVVVATGSAPVRKICSLEDGPVLYINDIYEPSIDKNLETIRKTLNNTSVDKDRNILFIGSNASVIEMIYLMEGDSTLSRLINNITLVSPSGALPHPTAEETLSEHPLPNLDKLSTAGSYDIDSLVDAATEEIRLAMVGGAHMDYVATIIGTTLKMLESLSEDDQRAFIAIHAIRLRNQFRRAGSEYIRAVRIMENLNKLKILKGKFQKMVPSEHGVSLQYEAADSGSAITHPLAFPVVINCTGSDDLNISASRLLYNLINNKICRMNLSRKGIEVNEHFEAAPHLYIFGPLLGGNKNKLIHFWQLENAARLTGLSPHLADELLAN